MARQTGTGFVNLEEYLNANRAAGQQMAGQVAGETARQGDAQRAALAQLQGGTLAPLELQGQMQATGQRAQLAGPGGGGLQSVMAADFGRNGPYTSGMSSFDAFLAGGAGGRTLADSANRYGGLGGEVDAYNKKALEAQAAAPTAPAAASPQAPAGPSFPKPRAPVRPGYAPSTYNPEPMERNLPPRKKGKGARVMDPNSWMGKPWGGV